MRPGTFWFILSDDRDCLACILQGNGSLLVAGIAEVNTIDLERGEAESLEQGTRLQPTRAPAQELWAPPRGRAGALTERIWSPFRSSPLRSAGPPARIKEMKMPSPSSPPTMLKPRPVEPRWITIRLGSRGMSSSPSRSLATGE